MSKSFLICGNYGATNLGDEAILAGTILQIHNQHPTAKIKALSYNPDDTKSRHKIPANYFLPFGIRSILRGLLKLELFKTLRAIRSCDVFILGGGGLFSNEHWKANAIWSLHALTALILGKKLQIHAQTVEMPQTQKWRRTIKYIFDRAQAPITVRDQESAEVLASLGIKKEIKVIPDPAWELKNQIQTSSHRSQELLISIRPFQDQTPKIKKIITETISSLPHDYQITFIPFQTLNSNDLALMKEIQTAISSHPSLSADHTTEKARPQIFIPKTHEEALARIASAKGIIAMRLHACIFAAITDTPFISISYSPKVSSFSKTQNALNIELSDLTAPKLTEAIRSSF